MGDNEIAHRGDTAPVRREFGRRAVFDIIAEPNCMTEAIQRFGGRRLSPASSRRLRGGRRGDRNSCRARGSCRWHRPCRCLISIGWLLTRTSIRRARNRAQLTEVTILCTRRKRNYNGYCRTLLSMITTAFIRKSLITFTKYNCVRFSHTRAQQ